MLYIYIYIYIYIIGLLDLVIQLMAKESKAKENNAGIRCLFVLILEKRYLSHHSLLMTFRVCCIRKIVSMPKIILLG